jgi:hypothetical protein
MIRRHRTSAPETSRRKASAPGGRKKGPFRPQIASSLGQRIAAGIRNSRSASRFASLSSCHCALYRLRGGYVPPTIGAHAADTHRDVSLAFADKWLLRRLDTFRRDHPGCELRIDTSKSLIDFAAGHPRQALSSQALRENRCCSATDLLD